MKKKISKTAPPEPRFLETAGGTIEYPAYIPVTTFGNTYPLDALIQPYLPRLAPAIMVSFHYAQSMRKKPRLPVLIDSGGFAALFEGSEIVAHHGLGYLRVKKEDETDELTPAKVLDFQERRADVGFTLDFPIPPDMAPKEARCRMELTKNNAVWALENKRRKDLRLFASLQGLHAKDYLKMARELSTYGFDGFAVGGLVPRARNDKFISTVVKGIREIIPDRPLHIFGLGKPETTRKLFDLGVDSVDSSSYVKMAADGKSWSHNSTIQDPAVTDRVSLALQNLIVAAQLTPFGEHLKGPIGFGQ
jgi:queuine/archaeosine tRNA-ribosyltransferase